MGLWCERIIPYFCYKKFLIHGYEYGKLTFAIRIIVTYAYVILISILILFLA